MENQKRIPLTLYATPETFGWIKALSIKEDRSLSATALRLLLDGLRQKAVA